MSAEQDSDIGEPASPDMHIGPHVGDKLGSLDFNADSTPSSRSETPMITSSEKRRCSISSEPKVNFAHRFSSLFLFQLEAATSTIM